MNLKNGINKTITGTSKTEAWADAKKVDKDTKVNTPSEEAVEAAKAWIEENEK
ncbi:MAG: DUF3787 domain-containing protein [Acidaminobacteraceae bacterium]